MTAVLAIAIAGFVWLAAFQILLAIGAPFGHMAWGGGETVLSHRRRAASAAIAVLAGSGVALCLIALMAPAAMPGRVLRIAHGAFAVLFGLSLIANAMSSSRAERLHGVPLTLILAGANGWLAWTSA